MITFDTFSLNEIDAMILFLQEEICEKILQEKVKEGKIVFSEVERGLLN